MASLGNEYQNAKPMDDFSPIPVGDYKAVITESEVKETKNRDGQYLNLRIEVIEGKYAGRIIFVILNLWNANPKAVEIANRELATIVAAVGKPGAQDSTELHNLPMTIKVGIDPGNAYTDTQGNKYEATPKNKIKNYLPYATTDAAPLPIQTKPAPQQGGTAQTADINPATGNPWKPWEKRS